MKKVNFFIVGAPKCATTSVYRYLDSHPLVFMSKPKEINYFSSEDIKNQKLYYQEKVVTTQAAYDRIFTNVGAEHILGDASVSYFYYPNVPKRIFDYNKEAKILIILRDPVERAYSHYLMDKRLGYIDTLFENVFHNKDTYLNHFQQYFQLSMYSDPVERYISQFGERNVKILFDMDIRKDPESVYEELTEFLDIQPMAYSMNRQHNTYKEPRNPVFSALYSSGNVRRVMQKIIPRSISARLKGYVFKSSDKPILGETLKVELYRFFDDDITRLEKLINRDLSHWHQARVMQ